MILGTDIYGGPGMGTSNSNGNIGLYISGSSAVLGSTSVYQIKMNGGSLGMGSGEIGIVMDQGGTV